MEGGGKAIRGLLQSPHTGEMVTVGVEGNEEDKCQNIQVVRGVGFHRGLGVGRGAGYVKDASSDAMAPMMTVQKELAGQGREEGCGGL